MTDKVDAAFNDESGIAACPHCGATAPYRRLPNMVTSEVGTAWPADWPHNPGCPVEALTDRG